MSNIVGKDPTTPLVVSFKDDKQITTKKDIKDIVWTKKQEEFLAENTCKGVCHHEPCGKKATQEVQMNACACRTAGKYWMCDACAEEYRTRPRAADILMKLLTGRY